MTSGRAIEYRITRNLLAGEPAATAELGLARRTIAVSAVAAGLLLFGSLAPGLVIAAFMASLTLVISL